MKKLHWTKKITPALPGGGGGGDKYEVCSHGKIILEPAQTKVLLVHLLLHFLNRSQKYEKVFAIKSNCNPFQSVTSQNKLFTLYKPYDWAESILGHNAKKNS